MIKRIKQSKLKVKNKSTEADLETKEIVCFFLLSVPRP